MENIAIIVPSLKGGGAERVASILSRELSDKYNIYLIIFNGDDKSYPYDGKLIDLDIKAHTNLFMKFINVFRRIYATRKIKEKYNINISISFMFGANIVNYFSKHNDKIILSVRAHLSARSKGILSRLNKIIRKNTYNKADQVIAVSKGVAVDLIIKHEIKEDIVEVIYNPVNIKEIEELTTEVLTSNELQYFDGFTIINVGRLTDAKGQWHLIRAMSRVVEVIPKAKLIIIGEGELEDYLKQLVNDLGINDNIIFLGYKKNVFKYIKKSDLFVLSSLYEGFPNVLIEAMACGMPVISTDCNSGPREILAPVTFPSQIITDIEYGEYGVLTPVLNGERYQSWDILTTEEEILGESIIKIYENEALRNQYSLKSYERAEDVEVHNILNKWNEIIER